MARRTRNFADAIRAKLRSDPDLAELVSKESLNAEIAQKVYDLRRKAGLTQKQLADRASTKQSVISRIEDADYDGHSLALLKRIADACGSELRVEFLQKRKRPQASLPR
jgi:ribosome-binding protein aMBF1 (putative translation factor)